MKNDVLRNDFSPQNIFRLWQEQLLSSSSSSSADLNPESGSTFSIQLHGIDPVLSPATTAATTTETERSPTLAPRSKIENSTVTTVDIFLTVENAYPIIVDIFLIVENAIPTIVDIFLIVEKGFSDHFESVAGLLLPLPPRLVLLGHLSVQIVAMSTDLRC